MVNVSSPRSDIRHPTRPHRPCGKVSLFRRADSGENGVVPAREWLHEIKYDGFRLRVERDGESGAADHAWRLRLDEALSLDRRVRSEEPHQAIRDRWRGGCSGRASFSHQFQNTNFPTSKAKTLTHATVTLMNVTDSITPTARSRPLSSGQSNQRFIAAPLNQVDR